MEKQILVVDDDDGLRTLLVRYLQENGFQAVGVGDGAQMWKALETLDVACVVLDQMLPGDDGLSLIRKLRPANTIPIIMVSARGEDIDRIVGLEVGADDYIAKPFNPRELLARIRAVLRRQNSLVAEPTSEFEEYYRFGNFELLAEGRRLTKSGEPVELSTAEMDLLIVFATHADRSLTRDQLMQFLTGKDVSTFDRSIDVRVTRLRRKIEENPKKPRFIRTVWGVGYMFSKDAKQAEQ